MKQTIIFMDLNETRIQSENVMDAPFRIPNTIDHSNNLGQNVKFVICLLFLQTKQHYNF